MRKTLVTIGISTATVNAIASPLMFVLQGPSRDNLLTFVAYPSIAAAIALFAFMLFDRKTRAAITAYNLEKSGGQMLGRWPTLSDAFEGGPCERRAAGFLGILMQVLGIELILAILTSQAWRGPNLLGPAPMDLAMLGMFSAGLAFMPSLGERFEGEIPPDPKINAAGWIALVVLGIPAIAVVALLVYFVEP